MLQKNATLSSNMVKREFFFSFFFFVISTKEKVVLKIILREIEFLSESSSQSICHQHYCELTKQQQLNLFLYSKKKLFKYNLFQNNKIEKKTKMHKALRIS